jgi:hypothetical protein
MKSLACLIVCVTILSCGVRAKAQYWTIGPKLGYTLGDNGGFTWGFEATYLPAQPRSKSDSSFIASIWGITADLTFWKDHSTLHFGIEKNFDILGVDVGPTGFFYNGHSYLGFSIIPYAGFLIYGYYEYAQPIFDKGFQSWGGYLKVPLVNFTPQGSAF